MAYKNSGAIKFNDATDLVIRADPDGTVESVFNKADSVEYINKQFVPPENYHLTINNNSSAAKTIYYLQYGSNGYLTPPHTTVAAGSSLSLDVFKHSNVHHAVSNITIVSGSVEEKNNQNFIVNSDAEINFID